MQQPSAPTREDDLDRKALEDFVIDNEEFVGLEALLDQFNLFEAIGVIRQELRHSDFLAFLLDPQQNHGLGDALLKRMLQFVLLADRSTSAPVTPIDLDVWSLNGAIVRREWQDIDIIITDELHRLVVIIENKINSDEHSDQLSRYLKRVRDEYPGWNVICLYLTPDGELPTDDAYLAVDYGLLCKLIETLVKNRASTLGTDVLTVINHYTQMLRRHIVHDTEIDKLCLRIYQKHKRALDLIYERRPDRQREIQKVLQGLIAKTPGLILDYSSKGSINFVPQKWDIPSLKGVNNYLRSGRIILFQFENNEQNLVLKLKIVPGPQNLRQSLFAKAQAAQPPFKLASAKVGNKFNIIYNKQFLGATDYDDTGIDDVKKTIEKQWHDFVGGDLPLIITHLP